MLHSEMESKDLKLSVWLRQISIVTYLLVMVFAVASWIDINGLWVEVPLIVDVLPEGWSLPSYMVIIIQIANIGPLAYMVAQYCAPLHTKEAPVIYLIIMIGAAMCILLAFFWDHTIDVHGTERSIPLLILSSFLALVDCTSSVVFLPYMALFKPQYMSAFYIGEGLSGLIPGVVGLAQGAGSDPTCVNETIYIYNDTTGINSTEHRMELVYGQPLFSIETFFFLLFAIMCCSGLAFSCLHFLKVCQDEKVKSNLCRDSYGRAAGCEEDGRIQTDTSYGPVLVGSQDRALVDSDADGSREVSIEEIQSLSKLDYVLLLTITALINGITNGVLPSIQSYSSLPYSNLTYTLSVRLSTIANPLACFLALFIRIRSRPTILFLTLIGCALFTHQMVLASLSPSPPLQGHLSGEILVVLSAVLLTGLFSYVKVSIASILQHDGRRALMWCGGMTQAGSLVGAVAAFLAVNVFSAFQTAPSKVCSS